MSVKAAVQKLKVLDGNGAAAYGVLLARPDLVAVYPITPQTSLIEKLCEFKAEGMLDCEIVTVEGENSAMGAVIGTSAAGGRTFTATSSMGLDFMYDSYIIAAGLRLPVVMVNVNRDQQPPSAPVAGGCCLPPATSREKLKTDQSGRRVGRSVRACPSGGRPAGRRNAPPSGAGGAAICTLP